MKNKLPLISRLLLGLIYTVFGLNGFLNFIPPPKDGLPEGAVAFFTAVVATKYFIPLLKGTEIFAGLLLLSGQAVPLALVILAPITIQIFFFHAFLTPGPANLIMPVVMIALHLAAASKYRAVYRPLFTRG